MRLASVHTYPVKGCYRRDHESSTVEPWGLAGDRRWLVTDLDGRGLTQREVPDLTRVRPVPVRPVPVRPVPVPPVPVPPMPVPPMPGPTGGLRLTASGMAELAVPEPVDGEPVDVSVHGTKVAATAAGPAADTWLTRALGREVRLAWLHDPTRRPVDPAFAEPTDRVSFADAYPLLLTNTASLDALNGWITADGSGEPLPMTRFRPNVVVTGAPAWAEDDWLGHRLRIGAVTFRVVKPCARCVVTTTDQETGVKGREPLRTLGRYRNIDQKLLFGMNLVPDPPYGAITTGDPVDPLG